MPQKKACVGPVMDSKPSPSIKPRKQRRPKYPKYLIAIFLVAFLLRLFPLDTSYFFWDESVYMLHARYFAGQAVPYDELDIRPPLLSLMISPLYYFGISPEAGSRIIMAIANSFIVLAVYLLGREISQKTAWLSAAIAAFMPYGILAGRWVMTDSLAAMLSGFAVYFFWRAFRPSPSHLGHEDVNSRLKAKANVRAFGRLFGQLWDRKDFYAILSGVFFSLAILMKFTSMLVAAVLAFIFFSALAGKNRKAINKKASPKTSPEFSYPSTDFRRTILPLAYFLFSSIIVMLPYLIFNYLHFGNPFQVFVNAFHVVEESQPASMLFSVFSLFDFYGVFMLAFIAALALLLMQAGRMSGKTIGKQGQTMHRPAHLGGEGNYLRMLAFWAVLMLAYYLFILQRGVSKPPGIEWEAERFLLPSMLPVIILGSAAISGLGKKAAIAVVAIALALQAPVYERIYKPAIQYEDGLRFVSRDISLYAGKTLGADARIYCTINCPVIAYYSGRQTIYVPPYLAGDAGNNKIAAGSHAIEFVQLPDAQQGHFVSGKNLTLIKSMEHGSWKALLYGKV
jgi:hypothetical protein